MHAAFNLSDRIDCSATDVPRSMPAQVVTELVSVSSAPAGVEWVDPAKLTLSHQAEWHALAIASGDANVFAEPWMVLAGLQHCAEGSKAVIAFVRDESRRLIGVAPLAVERDFGRVPIPTAMGWSHPNSFLTSWTVARGDALCFWQQLLPAIATGPGKAPILCLDGLPSDSALHGGLIEAARQLRIPVSVEGSVVRAMLATKADPEAYWDESVRAKKRKELRRQWARLNEQGELTTEQLSTDTSRDVNEWLAEFLELEGGGWKGANGSALASHPDTRDFFLTAMRSAHEAGQIEITALRINGRAIAMLITLFSGSAGFSFKTAFDEEYARFSPGVLLQRESLALLSQRQLDWIDSCAAQDHPMIDSLWRERRTILTVALPLPGLLNRLSFEVARASTRLWHLLKTGHADLTRVPRPDPMSGAAPTGPLQDDPS